MCNRKVNFSRIDEKQVFLTAAFLHFQNRDRQVDDTTMHFIYAGYKGDNFFAAFQLLGELR